MAPSTPTEVRRISLSSDGHSPNSLPHGLPALLWKEGASEFLSSAKINARLQERGWSPQWTFPMFKESHYHSTTHELLTIFRGSATLLLGGTDDDVDKSQDGEAHARIEVQKGDVLLLPAGYAHRAIADRDGFCMIGSYPVGGKQWDSELRLQPADGVCFHAICHVPLPAEMNRAGLHRLRQCATHLPGPTATKRSASYAQW